MKRMGESSLSLLLVHDGNRVDFDQPFGTYQAFNHDEGTSRRVRRVHEFVADLADDRDLRDVHGFSNIDVQLDDVAGIASGSLNSSLQVLEHLLRLCAEIVLSNKTA